MMIFPNIHYLLGIKFIMNTEPCQLTATEAFNLISSGSLSSVDLVTSCLNQISKTENIINAWEYLNADNVMAQSVKCDQIYKAGKKIGPLHGIPVGLKDIIDTESMPTHYGTTIFNNHQPKVDAKIVKLLKASGAIIMGKTVTTEFAFFQPSKTSNPHSFERTPGGSSSGSAAAVAANHVPLSVGTQTNGSVIRPASFCGVHGFKPSNGFISRLGVLQTSQTLDQIGCFGRSISDVMLISDIMGLERQSAKRGFSSQRLDKSLNLSVSPKFAWLDLPFYDRLKWSAREGLTSIIESLGDNIKKINKVDQLYKLTAVHTKIYEYEIYENQNNFCEKNWDQISDTLKLMIIRGSKVSKNEYSDALAMRSSAQDFFADFFTEFDAIVAPSAAGEAPFLKELSTGDPIFCTLWTLAGLPSVNLPILCGVNKMPIGVQLIGKVGQDESLLKTANWLQQFLANEANIKGK